MHALLSIVLVFAQPGEGQENDPRKELATAIPHFAKLLEDGKIEEFVDTAVYPPRLKSVLKQMSRERLIEGYREHRMEIAKRLREIETKKLEPKPFKPLIDEYQEAVNFTFSDGAKIAFYRKEGIWTAAL